MLAIKHALEYANTNAIDKPCILTDSLSSCQTIENHSKDIHITETISEILTLMSYTQASIIWLPSHVGIDGNEMADKLAGEAIMNGRELSNKIRQCDAVAMMKNELKEKHQQFYEESETGQKFKNIYGKLNDKPWYHKSGDK